MSLAGRSTDFKSRTASRWASDDGGGGGAGAAAPSLSVAFKCDGFQHLVTHGRNAQSASWDASLDALPAIAGLHASSRPKPRAGRPQQQPLGAALPASLAQAGGPRAGLGGIMDALALLPDLKVPSRTR